MRSILLLLLAGTVGCDDVHTPRCAGWCEAFGYATPVYKGQTTGQTDYDRDLCLCAGAIPPEAAVLPVPPREALLPLLPAADADAGE